MRIVVTFLKKMMPASLFGRVLLILVVPTVLAQLLTAYIFFERHWDNVTRHMSSSLAAEMVLLVNQHEEDAGFARIAKLARLMDIEPKFYAGRRLKSVPRDAEKEFPEFSRQLQARLNVPFNVEITKDKEYIFVNTEQSDGVLQLRASIKRLASSTTTIFIWWMVGSASLLFVVAVMFLRNQIRGVATLAEAAESFGKGQDMPFRPSGASEVRRAARAFLVMKERLRRQISTRVEMLAGISHDLRTPLTRMKLQLAMMPESTEIKDLSSDVVLMEHMIQEYLDFARGEGKEETSHVMLTELLGDAVKNYQRQNQPVKLRVTEDTMLYVRRRAFGRCLANLIDNALRYGKSCSISVRLTPSQLDIYLDDEGQGIAPENRVVVFRPFTRLETSRNQETGGVGLGLTIARDIVVSHGGEIILGDSPSGGLRVTVRLPL